MSKLWMTKEECLNLASGIFYSGNIYSIRLYVKEEYNNYCSMYRISLFNEDRVNLDYIPDFALFRIVGTKTIKKYDNPEEEQRLLEMLPTPTLLQKVYRKVERFFGIKKYYKIYKY